MKNFLPLIFIMAFMICKGQNNETIKLNEPDKSRGLNVMKALDVRKSDREYANKVLELQDLSDLLWAANGINRPESGKRTAPSAMNKKDIDIYVCMPNGAYLYDAKQHSLTLISNQDARPAIAAGQDFVTTAPVVLVMVSDLSRFDRGSEEQKLLMAALDAGIVSQNISIFCASVGLVTVPRLYMENDKLKTILKLTDNQLPLINNPVGYSR